MYSDRIDIHVSTIGSPYGNGSVGYPVPSLAAAMQIVRRQRTPGQRAAVWVHPGTYRQHETLTLTSADSYTSICAWEPDEPTIIEGAQEITNWSPAVFRGTAIWVADAPTHLARSLFVNGERRPRPRYPREGFLRIAEQKGLDVTADFVATLFDGADRFGFVPDDIPDLTDESSVEAVVPHYWLQERMAIASVDRESNVVHSTTRSIFALRDDAARRFARYFLENVVDTLGDMPGEWYLDRHGVVKLDGESEEPGRCRLLYVPRDGERIDEHRALVPCIDRFVVIAGEPAIDSYANEIRFEGIDFRYADWLEAPSSRPPYGVREDPVLPRDVDYAAGVQAASEVPAAIEFIGARSCAFVLGSVEHVGGYAISLGPGCRGNLIAASTFTDLGAGAIKAGGDADPASNGFTRANTVIDNEIRSGGHAYPHAVAVLFMHGSHNTIAHNHIRDFFYTGVSVGWVWDYEENPSHSNLIEANHIHDLGRGLLNDMGGVYLLGIAPGTRVRGNHIHDIACANYGGWGIYLDEGSSHVVVEGNVVHDVSSQCCHHHYGRENTLRYNIFAYGGQGQLSITRPESSVSFTCERNVIVGENSPGFAGTPGSRDVRRYTVVSDLNLFWDTAAGERAVIAANGEKTDGVSWSVTEPVDREWIAAGHDAHSVIADPLFADAGSRDFTLMEESPAFALGFRVPNTESAGPRRYSEDVHPLAPRTRRLDRGDAERA
ncbi:right-handed parallel beta-helix repeat-containing protein [Rathayibacter soli]|uniref:right-handed parallel beta-helix repeat-containing protein n=1 Tax=Rathayibacter soli TaxID=3144168 RepID=UPI0027E5BA13|nr:right-handed parallel beta-helix repeat-containing protein [Glaciibacter superstes]